MKDRASSRTAVPERQQSIWTWLVPACMLALLGVLYFVWPAFQAFVDEAYDVLSSGERQRAEAWVGTFGPWGVLVIVVLMLMQSLLAVIPSMLIMIVAVLSYGPVLGGVLAWGSLVAAASFAYGIGRLLGPVTVEKLVGAKTRRKIARFIEHYGLWAVIAARVSPPISTDAVSYAAGLMRMRFSHFLLATAAGTVPLAVLVAYLGSDIDRLKTGLLWVSAISLLTFIGYVWHDHRRRRH